MSWQCKARIRAQLYGSQQSSKRVISIRISPFFNNPIHTRSLPSPCEKQSGSSAHCRHESFQTTRSVPIPNTHQTPPEALRAEWSLPVAMVERAH
jgi:hypothetical protein